MPPCSTLPAGQTQLERPSKTLPPGHFAQTPLMMKALLRLEQTVQTPAELVAYPFSHTQTPFKSRSLALQKLQLSPSLLGLEPDGQTWQAPLTLPRPPTHRHRCED